MDMIILPDKNALSVCGAAQKRFRETALIVMESRLITDLQLLISQVQIFKARRKCMIKKMSAVFLSAVMLLCGLCFPAAAEQEIVINGNELESFKGRTKEQITSLWQTAEIADYESIFEEGKQSSYVAPYSGGTVRQDVLDNVWRNLNYYRYLIGSPQITERLVNQPDMQNASVLQAINLRDRENGVGLTHSLWEYKKPDDMDQGFYDSAVYANHNIISSYTYQSAIRGFFGESHFTYTAGHRTSLLSPYIGSVQMGIGGATYGLTRETAEAQENFSEKFAAYPSPGYFPKQDMASQSDWDIYLNEKVFKQADEQSVFAKITDLETGESFDYSKQQGNLSAGRIIFLKAPRKDEGYLYSHSYKVEIFGLRDTDDREVKIEYTVNFFDKFEGVGSTVKNVGFADTNKSTVFTDAASFDEAVKKASPFLPKAVEVSLESGIHFVLDITGWTFENRGYSYFPGTSDEIVCTPAFNSGDIPKNVEDPESIHCNFSIYIFEKGKSEFSGNTEGRELSSGQTAELDLSVDYSGVKYTWYKLNSDNSVSRVSENERITVNVSKLTVSSLEAGDSGRYFVVADADNFMNFFYISGLITLDVDQSFYTCGDVNDDGRVSSVDALLTLKAAVGKIQLSQKQKNAADVDSDNDITVIDALKILCFAVKKIEKFR